MIDKVNEFLKNPTTLSEATYLLRQLSSRYVMLDARMPKKPGDNYMLVWVPLQGTQHAVTKDERRTLPNILSSDVIEHTG